MITNESNCKQGYQVTKIHLFIAIIGFFPQLIKTLFINYINKQRKKIHFETLNLYQIYTYYWIWHKGYIFKKKNSGCTPNFIKCSQWHLPQKKLIVLYDVISVFKAIPKHETEAHEGLITFEVWMKIRRKTKRYSVTNKWQTHAFKVDTKIRFDWILKQWQPIQYFLTSFI